MSKHIRLALFAAALLTLAACGQPVPNDKVAYVDALSCAQLTYGQL